VDLLYKKEVFELVGAAMEVHGQLGNGFLEAVYQEALEIEFIQRKIHFEKEKHLNILYKGKKLKKYYIADFLCFDKVIVELKAVSDLTNDHDAQVLNYLKTTGIKVGLLLNFGTKSLQFKRLVLT